MRLIHVLDKHPEFTALRDIPQVIEAMIVDLKKECDNEIVWSNFVIKAIGGKTVSLYKAHLDEVNLAKVGKE